MYQEGQPPAHSAPGFTRRHLGLIAWLLVIAGLLIGADAALLVRKRRYAEETARLREAMTDVERARTDAELARQEDRLRVMLALGRHQAQLDDRLHLAVALDSGTMTLEREGAVLRVMPVQLGPERTVGVAPDTVRMARPRGTRTIVAVLGPRDGWDVPAWVWRERGLPVPPDSAARRVPGALGAAAVILEGGTLIYAQPASGPLADSAYVLPGALRARASDLQAVRQSLAPGTTVYFY